MKPKVKNVYSLKWKIFIIYFVAILISISIPLLFIALLPIFVLRIFVSYLSKFLRPDLGEMLNALSSVFASDDFKNPKLTTLKYYIIKGSVDVQMLKSKMIEKVIGVRKVGKDLKNIELKQYPYKWMGFIFWKWDKNFDISNHVKYYEGEITKSESKISQERLIEIKHEFLFRPYKENQSPWDITVFPNIPSDDKGPQTLITFRFHHSMGDGFSITKLICGEIMDEAPKEFLHKATCPTPGVFQRILQNLKHVKFPYDIAKCVVESYSHNDWQIKESTRSNKYIEVTVRTPLNVIKDLAKELNTSVSTVILSAVAAGFRHSMLMKDHNVPRHIQLGQPLPREGHPDKLTNFCSGSLLKLPVGESDSLSRLRKTERFSETMTKSSIPFASLILLTSVGWTLHWMMRPVAKLTMFSSMTGVISLFAGPKGKLTIFGQEIMDIQVSLGPQLGNCGITFNTYSYCNHLNMTLMVNSNILNQKKDVEELMSNVLRELKTLKKCVN